MRRLYFLVTLLCFSVLYVQVANAVPKKKYYASSNNYTSSNKINDRDGDGVPDDEDLCPDIPGPAKSFGCPDSDGDGVPDFKDDCPDVPGHPDYNGCPDSDGDGIPDNKDACPFEPGPADNNGCPVKRLDADTTRTSYPNNKKNNSLELTSLSGGSIYDYKTSKAYTEPVYYIVSEDPVTTTESIYDEARREIDRVEREKKAKRKEEKTEKTNKCRILKIHNNDDVDKQVVSALENNLANVKFEHGRIKLKNEAKLSLDQLAELLSKNPKWGLFIHSYANDADNSYRNMQLSENRGSVLKGVISTKVDKSRIAFKGYGNAKGDNITVFEILK